jgi:Tol biopolymer transport system component
MGDVRVELQESLAPPSGVAPASVVATDTFGERRSRWARPSRWLAGSIAGAIAAFVAGLMVAPRGKLERAPSMPPTHIPVAVRDEGRIHYSFFGRPLAISPDGQRIAYAGIVEEEIGIWLLNLEDARGAIPVEGTRLRYGPFFSPDGESLGSVDVNGGVEVVSLSGGKPRSVWGGPSLGRTGPTWDDAWIYYVDDTGAIGRIAASGDGSPQVMTKPPPSDRHTDPQTLPGGEHILHSVWRGALGQWSIAVTTIATGEQTVLFEKAFAPRYLPTGHLVVGQEDVLLAMTLDLDTLKVGPSEPVLRGLVTDLTTGTAAYAVSDSGVLVYLTGALERDGWLVRVRPGAPPERLNTKPTDFDYDLLSISPDGRRVAVSRNDFDLWIFDLTTRDLDTRVTTDPGQDRFPIWGPGDDSLTYISTNPAGSSLSSRRADGLGPVEPLLEEGKAIKWPESWSPMGERLLYSQLDPETGRDLWIVPRGRPAAAEVFLRTKFNENWGAFSPDGRWVAYGSDETGRFEIYVTSYPDKDIKRRVSREGGLSPRWSADGKRLFFVFSGDVMVVEATDSRWTPSAPELFVERIDARNWDVTPDGQSVIALEQRPNPQLHMVQNWVAELERLVRTD